MVERTGLKKKRFFVAIDFSRYKGRYVAVVGRRVVASGTNCETSVVRSQEEESFSSARTSQGPEGRDSHVVRSYAAVGQ